MTKNKLLPKKTIPSRYSELMKKSSANTDSDFFSFQPIQNAKVEAGTPLYSPFGKDPLVINN